MRRGRSSARPRFTSAPDSTTTRLGGRWRRTRWSRGGGAAVSSGLLGGMGKAVLDPDLRLFQLGAELVVVHPLAKRPEPLLDQLPVLARDSDVDDALDR